MTFTHSPTTQNQCRCRVTAERRGKHGWERFTETIWCQDATAAIRARETIIGSGCRHVQMEIGITKI